LCCIRLDGKEEDRQPHPRDARERHKYPPALAVRGRGRQRPRPGGPPAPHARQVLSQGPAHRPLVLQEGARLLLAPQEAHEGHPAQDQGGQTGREGGRPLRALRRLHQHPLLLLQRDPQSARQHLWHAHPPGL